MGQPLVFAFQCGILHMTCQYVLPYRSSASGCPHTGQVPVRFDFAIITLLSFVVS